MYPLIQTNVEFIKVIEDKDVLWVTFDSQSTFLKTFFFTNPICIRQINEGSIITNGDDVGPQPYSVVLL